MSRFTSTLIPLAKAVAVLPLSMMGTAAPTTKPPTSASAAAIISELGNTMPQSFDIYPADPCAGVWDVHYPTGEVAMTISVVRYRNVPLVRVTGPTLPAMNSSVIRIDPRSIRTSRGLSVTLRCGANRALATVLLPGMTETITLNAVRGAIERTSTNPAALAATKEPLVREQAGDIQYVAANGAVRQITQAGDYTEPVLSPDGRTVAFIHLDGKPTQDGEPGFTSLWLADVATGDTRKLFVSKPDMDKPERNMGFFHTPLFSLDGGFVYVDADAWTTSTAVHQINVETGDERFVTAGWTLGVIRTGPHRGHLLVGQHKYRPAPQFGSYDSVSVVKPDGTVTLLVPGSDQIDGESSVTAWLAQNGWAAW